MEFSTAFIIILLVCGGSLRYLHWLDGGSERQGGKMAKTKTIKICSQECILSDKPPRGGYSGEFIQDVTKGDSCILLNTKGRSNQTILRMILHEVIEGIALLDGVTYRDSDSRAVFLFDHKYLEEQFCAKLLDALVSCGMVNLKKKII